MSSSEENNNKEGWLSRLLTVRKIDPGSQSHSTMLSDKDTVFELQVHSVKPEYMQAYLQDYEKYVSMVEEKGTQAELTGSWTVDTGDQDDAIHLWKYPGGYPTLNKTREIYRTDQDFVDYRINRNKMLRSRRNQILLAFSFWGDIQPRDTGNIYELRTYVLKPGTMIEWGNNWARGIHYRQAANEPVAGLFCQIGTLYTVHHFWAYKDLQTRKEVREAAWRRPGWDECVAYTVPLIRSTNAQILIPTPFSPLK